MQPGEAALLARIHAAAFPGGGWDEGFFRSAGESAADRVLVEGEPALGLVVVRFLGDEAEILTIAAGRRRQGTGSRLLTGAMAAAKASGAESLFLEVSVANKAALALYDRFGFERVGLRRRYYGNGEDAAVLRRSLSGGT
nr:GNAT family N-acetyltransferase [Parvularcula maris]